MLFGCWYNNNTYAATTNTLCLSKAKTEFLEAITWMDELQAIQVVKSAPKRFFGGPLTKNLDTPLHLASKIGSILTVVAIHRRVLSFQYLINMQNQEGKTPLQIAQDCDNQNIVAYFTFYFPKAKL